MPLTLSSSVLEPGGQIPLSYTCESHNLSPDLAWESVPEGTQSIALIFDDPDAPNRVFAHWVVYNIPPEVTGYPESVQQVSNIPQGGMHGRNTFGNDHYDGPCPPPGPEHRYYFRLFALDMVLALSPGATREQLIAAMQDHIIEQVELMVTFGSSR